MRRLLMPLIALVLAAPAWAGPHLRWDAPFGHPDAQTNKNFACDTNAGEDVLVVSFWAPDSVADVRAYIVALDGSTATLQVPDWWRIGGTSQCRFGSSLAFDPTPDPGWPVTALPGASMSPGYDFNYDPGGPNRFRLRFYVEADTLQPLLGIGPRSGEQFVCKVLLRRQRTVPVGATPACAGCSVPVCFSHARISVDGRGFGPRTIWEGFASIDQQHWVTWQGGGPHPCPAAVPTHPSSWGRIKASYR